MAMSRSSYLTKYGGTTSNTFQITTQNLTTDNLIVRGNVYGLTVFDDASFNSASIGNITITQDLRVPKNIRLDNNLIFTKSNINLYSNTNSGDTNSLVINNSTMVDPNLATLDILGGKHSLYVKSDGNSTLNTIAQTSTSNPRYGYGVKVGASNGSGIESPSAHIDFYSVNPIDNYNDDWYVNRNPPDSTIISTAGYLQLNTGFRVNNVNTGNVSAVCVNDFTANNIKSQNTIVYAPDATLSPYNYSVYENSTIGMGNAETLFATDNSSVTFMTISTPNLANGMRLGGGVNPGTNIANANNKQSILSLDIRDICGKFKPVQTIVTNTDPVINVATMGINNSFPDPTYNLDINGKTLIHNTQVEKVLFIDNNNNGYSILGIAYTSFLINPIATQYGITSFCRKNNSNIIDISLNVIYTKSSGKQWANSYINKNTSITNAYTNIGFSNSPVSNSDLYSSTTSLISLGDNAYTKRSLLYCSTNSSASYSPLFASTNICFLSAMYFVYSNTSGVFIFAGDNNIDTVSNPPKPFTFYNIDSNFNVTLNTDVQMTLLSDFINTAIFNISIYGLWPFTTGISSTQYILPSTMVVYHITDAPNYNHYIIFLNQISDATNSIIYITFFDVTTLASPDRKSYKITTPLSTPIIEPTTKMKIKIVGQTCVIYNTYIVSFIISTIILQSDGSELTGVGTVNKYHNALIKSINDVYIYDGNYYLAACNGSQLVTTIDAGVSWNIMPPFPNYGGPLFSDSDMSFNTVYLPNIGSQYTNMFISRQSAKTLNYDYFYVYDPYLRNPAINFISDYDIMDIYGNLKVYGKITATGNITTPTGNITASSGTVSALTITATGNITASSGTVSANLITSTGDITTPTGNITATLGTVTAVTVTQTSDYRIKDNIVTLTPDRLFLDQLNPVSYTNRLTNRPDFGLIAHELQEFYPELVNGEKDGANTQSVNYMGLISILIKEIQVLKGRIAALE